MDFLKNKYNKDFLYYSGYFYKPKDNQNLYFSSLYSPDDENSIHITDYYLSTMYQYELNKYVRKLLEDAKLSNKVVFLITTEPDDRDYYSKNKTGLRKYNFGKGYDAKEFLKNGYFGEVVVTFIHLGMKGDGVEYEDLRKLVIKLDDFIGLKIHVNKTRKVEKRAYEQGRKSAYIYYYNIDEYGRKIVVDLFKKYPITEHEERKRILGLAYIYSLSQVTRAETPGFHYLDIFAKPKLVNEGTSKEYKEAEFYGEKEIKKLRKTISQ